MCGVGERRGALMPETGQWRTAAGGAPWGGRALMPVLAGVCVLVTLALPVQGGSLGRELASLLGLLPALGTMVLGQTLMARVGYLDPALFGVTLLAGVVVGLHGTSGDGDLVGGVLLALLLTVPFALFSAALATNLRMSVAMVVALGVLAAADRFSGLLLPDTVNTTNGLLNSVFDLPWGLLLMLGAYALLAVAFPAPEGVTAMEGASWWRMSRLVFLPAFGLAVLAGALNVSQIKMVSQYSPDTLAVPVVLALAAGGCLLPGGASLGGALAGTLAATAVQLYGYESNLGVDAEQVLLTAVAVAFFLVDLARRGGIAPRTPHTS
ncbi:hypothetical protein POF50_030210 [Streptomyces sp. SL13]|uniref:Uncharacterized protein n=1 Tax=Streptantibioticus silvisoli TaxID=2705255 RepID=A0AA90H3R8_9ACTN|nr:hypothetical protein [Streptantibioticus silvisoli]MDI5973563.1 hypothetical protein [Streptantibioticus silvisoli]